MGSIDEQIQKGTYTLQEQRINLLELIKSSDNHEEYMEDVFLMYQINLKKFGKIKKNKIEKANPYNVKIFEAEK